MKYRSWMIVVAAVIPLLSFVGRNAWGGVQYTVTDLGTLGGTWSVARGINASGQVVGQADTASGSRSRLLLQQWNHDRPGHLGWRLSFACGINDSGQVVGDAVTSGGRRPRLSLHCRDHDRLGHLGW